MGEVVVGVRGELRCVEVCVISSILEPLCTQHRDAWRYAAHELVKTADLVIKLINLHCLRPAVAIPNPNGFLRQLATGSLARAYGVSIGWCDYDFPSFT